MKINKQGGFYGSVKLSTGYSQIFHDAPPYGEKIEGNIGETKVYADGYIYNLETLKNSYATANKTETILTSFTKAKETFPKVLKGDFSTVVYSPEKLIISTNHTCSRRVFYAEHKGSVYFHYSLQLLLNTLKEIGFKPAPNPVALRSLISIGGVFGNLTVVNGIYLLRAGEQLEIRPSNVQLRRYYLPETSPQHTNKKDFLQHLHEQFLTTVNQQYSHEEMMGFQLLSGGLDSRMNLSLALQNKINQEAVLCFGQTGYRDHWISKQIADKYRLKHDFVPLENGDYLTAIDENILAVDGLNFYASAAHFNYALDKTKYIAPIIHTGQIGRTIFTDHSFGLWQNLSEYQALLCSSRFADTINIEVKEEMNLYDDMDVFYLNNRLYRVVSSGNFVAQKIGYIVSPFADPDVQDLAYSMPLAWKNKGNIQWEYLWKYHKEIMQFSQEEYGRPVRSYPEMFLGKVQNKLRNIYYTKVHKNLDKLSMNPLEYWWQHNENLRLALDGYFHENIYRLDEDKELKSHCMELYNSTSFIEKTLAITAVGVMKNYFSE